MSNYRQALLNSSVAKSCIICGSEDKLYVHHKDNQKDNHKIDNLEFRCPSCHRKAHPTYFNDWGRVWDEHKDIRSDLNRQRMILTRHHPKYRNYE